MCLSLCCYGIDLGANLLRFNQRERSISTNAMRVLHSVIAGLSEVSCFVQITIVNHQGKLVIMAGYSATFLFDSLSWLWVNND